MPSLANRVHSRLPADVEKQVDQLQENAAYSLKLRDKDIGLDGAEKSCFNQPPLKSRFYPIGSELS